MPDEFQAAPKRYVLVLGLPCGAETEMQGQYHVTFDDASLDASRIERVLRAVGFNARVTVRTLVAD